MAIKLPISGLSLLVQKVAEAGKVEASVMGSVPFLKEIRSRIIVYSFPGSSDDKISSTGSGVQVLEVVISHSLSGRLFTLTSLQLVPL